MRAVENAVRGGTGDQSTRGGGGGNQATRRGGGYQSARRLWSRVGLRVDGVLRVRVGTEENTRSNVHAIIKAPGHRPNLRSLIFVSVLCSMALAQYGQSAWPAASLHTMRQSTQNTQKTTRPVAALASLRPSLHTAAVDTETQQQQQRQGASSHAQHQHQRKTCQNP